MVLADPVRIIFDTDMGNDIDDVFAMGMLHTLQSRGECEILAVSVSRSHALAAPFCDAINTFYGRPEIPIGVVKAKEKESGGDGLYLVKLMGPGTNERFPHKLRDSKDAPDAVALLRKALASQPDGSVVVVAVGFSTNLAGLMTSKGDEISALSGRDLVIKKVRRLVMMAGEFNRPRPEYNVHSDAKSARAVFAEWPTEIVALPFDVGESIRYPVPTFGPGPITSADHILLAADVATFGKPDGFMTWDLTAVLHAVRPAGGYFRLSGPGTIQVDENDVTTLRSDPHGRHRYAILDPENRDRVRDALVDLAGRWPMAKDPK
jgi:inosine-uridine nucleoside N-ribohydrolase